ncbi:restriction endonuclease subunit S [Marivirga salinae]|uniref:Restriction endonuclease subunit S n=1 Tax=Marivirga salinarum TaxID=3059078 RepID=A0AA51REI0_9BACT|nr:restriction endonuclease subunit S [Marivirga sp. BDSF4-3]WMN11730.1 restriction endonuclease subunit S [Marivirga sp. BDSF4-3]
MSYLEKILENAEFDWHPLGEVAELKRGKTITRKTKTEGNIPVISGGQKPAYYNGDYNRDGETITVAGSGAYAGYISYWNTPIFVSDAFSVKPDLSILHTRYVYHFLLNHQYWIHNLKKGVGVPHVYPKDLAILNIPIPSLEIQKKIVLILDSFAELTSELTTELTTELAARKQQYSYYREQLFCFEEGEADWISLNEIGEFQRGKRFVRTDLISEGVPTIHYGEMYTHYGTWADKTKSFVSDELVAKKKLRVAEKGDVVIVAAGETIEDLGKGTAWLGDEGVVIHDACFSYRSPLHPKYVAYFTRTRQYHDQIRKHISSGKISAIHSKGLSKVVIPVPSKDAQERIVSILDKFDVLTTSISQDLPKEIELRQQQYEYYRNLLLTFPKDNIEE